jgi:hypothetical protein
MHSTECFLQALYGFETSPDVDSELHLRANRLSMLHCEHSSRHVALGKRYCFLMHSALIRPPAIFVDFVACYGHAGLVSYLWYLAWTVSMGGFSFQDVSVCCLGDFMTWRCVVRPIQTVEGPV